MKAFGFFIVGLTGAFLIWATFDFPDWADPNAPASLHVSPYYIEKALEETGTSNIVTAVLADYRGYDTMFETTVIFAAGLVCFLLLRRVFFQAANERLYRHLPTGITIRIKGEHPPLPQGEFEPIDLHWIPHDIIIRTVCRLLVPFVQLFALYVIAHGHSSPGGGFQGGVILGASFILLAMGFNLRALVKRIREKAQSVLSTSGVFIYAATGWVCLLLGLSFLDYSALASLLGLDRIMSRSYGIFIVEVGVGIAVMGTMIWIYSNLSSMGNQDEGL